MKVALPSRQEVALLKEQYPKGTRIELRNMEDTWAVPAGTKGTVDYVDDAGQIHVSWDNGRSLALIPGVDSFHRITEQSQSQSMRGMKL